MARLLRYLGGFSGVLLFFLLLLPYFSNQFRSALRSFFKPLVPRLSQYYENDNDKLLKQVKELQEQLNESRFNEDMQLTLFNQVDTLKKRLKMKAPAKYNLIHAEIIAMKAITAKYRFVINKGKNDGLVVGAAVLSNGYFIGRVIEAGDKTATISTLLNEDLKVSCRVRGPGGIGIITGQFTKEKDLIKVNHLPRDVKYETGSEIETSGLGGIIPAGLLIGKAEEFKVGALNQEAKVKMSADLNNLSLITVIVPVEEKEE